MPGAPGAWSAFVLGVVLPADAYEMRGEHDAGRCLSKTGRTPGPPAGRVRAQRDRRRPAPAGGVVYAAGGRTGRTPDSGPGGGTGYRRTRRALFIRGDTATRRDGVQRAHLFRPSGRRRHSLPGSAVGGGDL